MMSNAIVPNNWDTTSIEKNTDKLSIGDVFNDRTGAYLNELTLFLARFNVIPNFIQGMDIDCYKANKWFVEKYHAEINTTHYNKSFSRENTVP